MKNKPLKLSRLRRILASFGCREDKSRGKGSHTMFFRTVNGDEFSYPIPTSGKEVLVCYIKEIRIKFRLTPDDGITDEAFFSRM